MAWAWQLLSSLSVTVPTEKPKHQPLRWFLAHLPSTSPEQSRGKEGPLPAPAPPVCPGPGNNFGSSALLSCLGKGPQGCRAEREPGLGGQEGAWHSVPPWEWPRGTEPSEKAWSFPSGRDPTGVSVFQKPGHGPVVASLPNLGLLLPGYFESWSSLAFCRIWQTSVMG